MFSKKTSRCNTTHEWLPYFVGAVTMLVLLSISVTREFNFRNEADLRVTCRKRRLFIDFDKLFYEKTGTAEPQEKYIKTDAWDFNGLILNNDYQQEGFIRYADIASEDREKLQHQRRPGQDGNQPAQDWDADDLFKLVKGKYVKESYTPTEEKRKYKTWLCVTSGVVPAAFFLLAWGYATDGNNGAYGNWGIAGCCLLSLLCFLYAYNAYSQHGQGGGASASMVMPLLLGLGSTTVGIPLVVQTAQLSSKASAVFLGSWLTVSISIFIWVGFILLMVKTGRFNFNGGGLSPYVFGALTLGAGAAITSTAMCIGGSGMTKLSENAAGNEFSHLAMPGFLMIAAGVFAFALITLWIFKGCSSKQFNGWA